VQTLQPFTTIDSLVRLGLAARPTEIELTTFDISRRVNDHILTLQDRAKTGAPYVLQLPIELGLQWAPGLVSYWKSIGDRIGSETPAPDHQTWTNDSNFEELRCALKLQPV